LAPGFTTAIAKLPSRKWHHFHFTSLGIIILDADFLGDENIAMETQNEVTTYQSRNREKNLTKTGGDTAYLQYATFQEEKTSS
jgi:hypothetical protein